MVAFEFFKSVKGIAAAVGILIAVLFLIFRAINKEIGETENVEINEINLPTPGEFESNCVRLTGQPCPRNSK